MQAVWKWGNSGIFLQKLYRQDDILSGLCRDVTPVTPGQLPVIYSVVE